MLMSLINFFKNNGTGKHESGFVTDSGEPKLDEKPPTKEETNSQMQHKDPPPEIPENIFVEYEKPKSKVPMETNNQQQLDDIHMLYRYLQQDLEKKGYEHALVNPDASYMQEHVLYLQNQLNLLISKVTTHYRNYLRQIDFHIDTRKRHDMVEMVDELLTHKANIEDEMKLVAAIEEDAKKGNGITQNVILSYKRGFKNGFAAITYGTILNRKN
jgi:hypothetical protein